MYYRAALVALGLSALSCTRQPATPQRERLAILRFENLGPDASTGWMGRAFSETILSELAEAPGIHVVPLAHLRNVDRMLGSRPTAAPGISAERSQALAAGAGRIGYGEYSVERGRLQARLTIMDTRTGKATQVVSASTAPGALLDAATQLAGRISNHIVPCPTGSLEALQGYAAALESDDLAAISANAARSIAADPNFGPPYRMLAQAKFQQQDRAGAVAVLEQALAHASGMPAAERARLQLEKAGFENDAAAQQQALANLVKASPADPDAWHAYAQTAYQRHDYRQSEQAWREYLAQAPEDSEALNLMAYAAAYAGDLGGAVSALRRYQALAPNDPNPLDSLGDVHLINGRLREAEGFYLEAAKKNPGFLNGADYLKAASARLMTGDQTGADALAKQFADLHATAKDPAVDLYRAQWAWISGRRKPACRELETFARGVEGGPLRELASRAYSELAVWSLILGNRTVAAEMAAKAVAQATPASASGAMVARFLAQPAAKAAEWTARAQELAPKPEQSKVRDFALAYALLLAKDFQAASVVLERLYQSGASSSDEGLPVLLAWSYLQTGRQPDAVPLLQQNPVPPSGGSGPFTSFYFPRLFFLRGLAAERAGHQDEAGSNYKLFLTLSGDQPLAWGEEPQARAGVAHLSRTAR